MGEILLSYKMRGLGTSRSLRICRRRKIKKSVKFAKSWLKIWNAFSRQARLITRI